MDAQKPEVIVRPSDDERNSNQSACTQVRDKNGEISKVLPGGLEAGSNGDLFEAESAAVKDRGPDAVMAESSPAENIEPRNGSRGVENRRPRPCRSSTSKESIAQESDAELDEITRVIKEEHGLLEGCRRKDHHHCLKIGEYLVKAKKRIQERNKGRRKNQKLKFGAYIKSAVGMEVRTAANYTALFAGKDLLSEMENFSNWSLVTALKQIRQAKYRESAKRRQSTGRNNSSSGSDQRANNLAKSRSKPELVVPSPGFIESNGSAKESASGTGGRAESADGVDVQSGYEDVTFTVAPDVSVSASEVMWKRGFLPYEQVEKTLTRTVGHDPSHSKESQLAFVRIASAVNGVIPEKCPPEALKEYLAALDAVRALIIEGAKPIVKCDQQAASSPGIAPAAKA